MPTICFDGSFSKIERTILSRTFHTNCRDLGIEKRDASIEVRRVPLGGSMHLGAITRFAPDRYLVLLNTLNDLPRCIFALGHEMVHFDQHTRGDMTEDHASRETIWKGKRYPAFICESKAFYNDLPWEKEAAEKHDWLMDRAVRSLSREQIRHVFSGYDEQVRLREAA